MAAFKKKSPISAEEALIRMADLCSRAEQCEEDIRMKLSRLGLPMSDIPTILTRLREQKFVDDARFAGSFARDKCRFSGWGKYKIRMALVAKRIPGADISAALESIDEADYREALRRTAEAKARSLELCGEEAKADRMKLYRHLLSRGFESELAVAEVKRLTALQRKMSQS